ncbi:hypothetical protein OG762_34545 [Streptomyces sp. NBC_01136]|nr:hypothetical protein OG762_34545 [Streptomyces sp. NBC_01136]
MTSGEVLTEVIARNDAATFTAFLHQLDQAIAPGKEIHVVLTPKHGWLLTRAGTSTGPHLTPPGSTRPNCSSPP